MWRHEQGYAPQPSYGDAGWEPEANATNGMNFFRPESEYAHYKEQIGTPGKAIKRLYKATGLHDSEKRRLIGGKLKGAAMKAKDAMGDLFYRIKNSGTHSQQFFLDDDDVMTKGYSNTMNELNKTINAVRYSMMQDRNYSALDGFDAAVRMFAEAAQLKKTIKADDKPTNKTDNKAGGKGDKKQSFWQKHKGKILTGAAALALAGGAGYGGYKWGQNQGEAAIQELQEKIQMLEKQKTAYYNAGKKAEAKRLGAQIASLKGQLQASLEMAKHDPMWYQKKQQNNTMTEVDERANAPIKGDNSWFNGTGGGRGTLG